MYICIYIFIYVYIYVCIYISCLAALASAPKTTVKTFCTQFMATLRNVTGLPKHTTVRELLMVLNKIHPLDRIQNAYNKYSQN